MKTTSILKHNRLFGHSAPALSIIICFLILNSISIGSVLANQGGVKWVKYSTKEGKAKIKFPASYEVSEEVKEAAKTVKIQTKLGENLFFMAYTLHSTQLTEQDNLAEVSLESFAETVKGKIIQQEELIVKSNNGIKAKIVMEEADADVYYWAIIIGQIQYQLIVLDVSKTIDTERDQFFKSFKILK